MQVSQTGALSSASTLVYALLQVSPATCRTGSSAHSSMIAVLIAVRLSLLGRRGRELSTDTLSPECWCCPRRHRWCYRSNPAPGRSAGGVDRAVARREGCVVVQTVAEGVRIETDVVFGRGGGRDLHCDVYRPDSGGTGLPAALVLHGGGWRRGSREAVRDQALLLGRAGFVAVAAEYRLSGESRWPARIHDTKTALRWLHASADTLSIDASKIAAVGFSAGAHLALLAAGTPGYAPFAGDGGHPDTSDRVAAVAAFYPPAHFHMPGEKRSGASPATALAEDLSGAEAEDAAPLSHVSADYPPTMLLQGTADKVVPVSASFRLHEALNGAGVPTELRIYHGLPHGFQRLPGMLHVVMADVASFLDRVMVAPDRYVVEGTMPPPA